MQSMLNLISSAQVYITLALMILVLILLVIIIIAYKSLNRLEIKYRKLMRVVNNKNLEDMVMSYLDKIDEVKEKNIEYHSVGRKAILNLKNAKREVAATII